MRLFVSYARVDKLYCVQIVRALAGHDVWYDQRLFAGTNWWHEIYRRLEWCEGFLWLLSPESLRSTACLREFNLAHSLGRIVFPLLIHPETELPEALRDIHHVDFSRGLQQEALDTLLRSLEAAEQEAVQPPAGGPRSADIDDAPVKELEGSIREATRAMQQGQYDEAVYLLRRAQAAGHRSRFVDLDAVLAEAEAGLQRVSRQREAEREYRQIASLVQLDSTRRLGCEAFQAFREQYPGHDPEDLAGLCGPDLLALSFPLPGERGTDLRLPASEAAESTRDDEPLPQGAGGGASSAQHPAARAMAGAPATLRRAATQAFSLPLLEWCEVPAGQLRWNAAGDNGGAGPRQRRVAAFRISRYPVTNAQFAAFVRDPQGYASARWWPPAARDWRQQNPGPRPPTFSNAQRPREQVTWYEAMAFCNWLADRLGVGVSLPTSLQWMRAARGDDERLFPWGDEFDLLRCNVRESFIRMTTQVSRYREGASPCGAQDMAGNVWEWCRDAQPGGMGAPGGNRLIHGGSFLSEAGRAAIDFRYSLAPERAHASIGFRLLQMTGPLKG